MGKGYNFKISIHLSNIWNNKNCPFSPAGSHTRQATAVKVITGGREQAKVG